MYSPKSFALIVIVLALSLIVWRCGAVAQFTFERQCRHVAGIEVKNPVLWHQYLIERRRFLVRSKVTVDGVEINPTDLMPVIGTDHFTWTSDWVLHGSPESPKNKAFRDDAYLSLKNTGEPVARFKDLRLRYDTIETTMDRACTTDYLELYTGSRPHRGAIMSVGR